MILREVAIGADNLSSTRSQTLSAVTEEMVLRHAGPIIECYRDELLSRRIVTTDFQKVYLALMSRDSVERDPKPFWRVAYLRQRFDVPRFMRAGVRGRHAMLVETIYRGLIAAARRYGFDSKPLRDVREAVSRRGLSYAGCLSSARWNTQRSAFGQLCVYGTYEFGQVQLYVCDFRENVVRGICIRQHRFVCAAKIVAILEQWQIKWKNADSLIVTAVRRKRPLRAVRVYDLPVSGRLRSSKLRDCSAVIRHLPPAQVRPPKRKPHK